MANKDSPYDPLLPVLTKHLGRRINMAEVYAAVGLSKPAYYEARDKGTLMRPDRLILAAHHLNINPIELLIDCDPTITIQDAFAFVEKKRAEASEVWEAGGRPLATATKERRTATVRRVELRPGAPPL